MSSSLLPTSRSALLSSRRGFLTGLITGGAGLPMATRLAAATRREQPIASTDPTEELIYMSATKLAGLIRTRKVSALEAVEAFIARQLEVNDRINAVVTNCYERARTEARELDRKAARGEFAGPLHGVPMTIKDSFDTAGVVSTGGTVGRHQYVPERDATVVARVRRAGAILLGKTNTMEFTLGPFVPFGGTGNWLFGVTRNPYDLARSPDGSSGGAAAIVAAGGAAFDIGTDWAGSIRGPASLNGIAGIKPTSGRVPRTGHIVGYGGIQDFWQQVGPLTRRVEDLAFITPLIAGPDYLDAACAPVPWSDPAAVELPRLRVAFSVDPNSNSEATAMTRRAAGWLGELGASVREDVPWKIINDLNEARKKLANGDGWAFYQRLGNKWGSQTLAPGGELRIKTRPAIPTSEMVEAWEWQCQLRTRMLEWFQSYDVYLCPAGDPAPLIDPPRSKSAASSAKAKTASAVPAGGSAAKKGGAGDASSASRSERRNDTGVPSRGIFNDTGLPAAVVRCGWSNDGRLPIGLQVVAQPWREDICLAVASHLESRSGGWRRPPI